MGLLLWLTHHVGPIVVGMLACAATFAALRHAKKTETRLLHERNRPLFERVMMEHGVTNVQILKDSTSLGIHGVTEVKKKPFAVHLILHSPPDRWFVYIHVEGSAPVLQPISEQRARAGLGLPL